MLETVPENEAGPTAQRRRGLKGLVALLALLLVAGGLAFSAFHYYSWCQQASGPRTPLTFTVREGASGSEVADALHERGVLRCGMVSGWLLRRDGLEEEIRAGTYRLTTNMTPDAAFRVLSSPPVVKTVRLTIPEGYRLTQIAERVRQELGIPERAFLEDATSGDWMLPPYLPKRAATTEGFLFPATYQFTKDGTTADDVIWRLLEAFKVETKDLPWRDARKLGVSRYQAVVIASMIEKEAKVERDRPLIASVIYNRLERHMPLGIDATLLYDDPTPDGALSESDLTYDSPYNTRLHRGLPPTPIASPGLPSLEAALEPANTDYLYYVLCGPDGHHRFAVTYQQHLRNVQACLG
jgi:UPF0755 protein